MPPLAGLAEAHALVQESYSHSTDRSQEPGPDRAMNFPETAPQGHRRRRQRLPSYGSMRNEQPVAVHFVPRDDPIEAYDHRRHRTQLSINPQSHHRNSVEEYEYSERRRANLRTQAQVVSYQVLGKIEPRVSATQVHAPAHAEGMRRRRHDAHRERPQDAELNEISERARANAHLLYRRSHMKNHSEGNLSRNFPLRGSSQYLNTNASTAATKVDEQQPTLVREAPAIDSIREVRSEEMEFDNEKRHSARQEAPTQTAATWVASMQVQTAAEEAKRASTVHAQTAEGRLRPRQKSQSTQTFQLAQSGQDGLGEQYLSP